MISNRFELDLVFEMRRNSFRMRWRGVCDARAKVLGGKRFWEKGGLEGTFVKRIYMGFENNDVGGWEGCLGGSIVDGRTMV